MRGRGICLKDVRRLRRWGGLWIGGKIADRKAAVAGGDAVVENLLARGTDASADGGGEEAGQPWPAGAYEQVAGDWLSGAGRKIRL